MSRACQPSSRAARSRRDMFSRRLCVEPLENRHLLAAIAGDFTGGTLVFAGDGAANMLEVANLAADTYVFTSAADTITITDAGGTLTIVGNGTTHVTVTATTIAIANLAIDLAGGGDTLILDALTGTAAAALKALAVNDTGGTGTDGVRLAGDVSIDGDFMLSGVENVLVTRSMAIDTEQGNDGNAGDVDWLNAVVSADAAGRDLTIDASTDVAFSRGVAMLGVFSNSPGPQFVHNLTINSGTSALLTGDMETTGDQVYNDAATVGGDVTLTATNVVFSGPLDDDDNGGTSSNVVLNTTGGGVASFGSPVGGTSPLTSLATNANGTTQINGNVSTTGGQVYNDDVTVGASSALTSTGAGNISFAGTVNGAFSLAINTAGTTTFGEAVGSAAALASLTTDAVGTTALNGGTVTTAGAQAYNDPVTLGANTLLTSTSAGNISFADTVNGAFSLAVHTAGTTTLAGDVGSTTALTSVTTDGAGASALSGGSVTTTGAQAYDDAVTLGANTALTSAGAGNISFASTVNGAFALTINTAGTTTLGDAIGGSTAPISVTTDATGTTAFNGGSVTTTGAQAYNDSVTVGADTLLTSTGSSTISFASTVNGAFTLTVNTAGTTAFGGAVGGTTALASLTTDPGGTTQIGGNITTAGDQAYNDAITLTADVILTSNAAGNITLAGSVNGAFSLTVNTTGTTTFGGNVGGAAILTALITNAGGTTHLDGGSVSATTQNYGDAVILGASASLGGTAGIVFNSTVDGHFDLQISGLSPTTFNAAVGGATPLDNLVLNAGSVTTQVHADITTTGNQSFANNTVVSNAVSHLVTFTGNFVQFLNFSTLNGGAVGESLTIVAAAGVPFNGVVGNTLPLKNLTVTANEGSVSAAGNITCTDNIQFTATETATPDFNNILVNPGVSMSSTGGNITLQAGDNITLLGNLLANLATGIINLTSLDAVDTPASGAAGVTGTVFTLHGGLQANQIQITGSAEDDDFDVKLSGIHSTNPPQIDGGSGSETRTALIRDGRNFSVNPGKRPFFVPAIAPADGVDNSIGDQLFLDDSARAAPDADYLLSGAQVFHIGEAQPFVKYQNIELLSLTTGRGNNDVTANLNVGPLPNIVQIVTFDPLDNDNRFQVEGTAGADKISIGDVGTTLAIASGPLRAHFELAGFDRLWVRGNAGADIIDNISKVPGVLDGGADNDTINSIVNDPQSKLILKQNIPSSTFKDVTLVLGNLGADQLFVGAGASDGPLATGSVAAALKAFPDRGITFLIGDYKPGSLQIDGRFKSLNQVVAGGQPGDTYSSSANAFLHGFVALKDSAVSRGNFKFGAGDKMRFSSTLAWLKTQIFVGVAKDNLVKLLAKQLEVFTRPVADSGEPEGAMVIVPPAAPAASPLTPITAPTSPDALLVLLASDVATAQRRRR